MTISMVSANGEAPRARYSPETGFNRSSIMTSAIAAARAQREFEARYAVSAKGIERGFKRRSWRFLISAALKSQWLFARAERAPYELAKASPSLKAELRSLSTDGRLAA